MRCDLFSGGDGFGPYFQECLLETFALACLVRKRISRGSGIGSCFHQRLTETFAFPPIARQRVSRGSGIGSCFHQRLAETFAFPPIARQRVSRGDGIGLCLHQRLIEAFAFARCGRKLLLRFPHFDAGLCKLLFETVAGVGPSGVVFFRRTHIGCRCLEPLLSADRVRVCSSACS